MRQFLGALMTMEYVRVRESTLKEVQQMLEKRNSADMRVIAAIFGLVVLVAITGLIIVL